MADAEEYSRDDQERRYEVTLDGELVGVATYDDAGSARTILHTIVDEAHEGHGIGTRLIEFALEDVRTQGMTLVPQCPMVAAYVDEHPEWQDLLEGPPA